MIRDAKTPLNPILPVTHKYSLSGNWGKGQLKESHKSFVFDPCSFEMTTSFVEILTFGRQECSSPP
jgi:hypothetical protein